jgi:cyclopropane-fatty-acyl-phospholipid synthase
MSTLAIPAAVPAAAELDAVRAFLARLFPAPRRFDVRLWDGTLLPAEGESTFTLVINAPGALRRMFSLPLALRLGESYLRGDFDLEGDVWAAAPGIGAYQGAMSGAGAALELFRLWRALPREDDGRDAVERARLGAAAGTRQWDLAGIRYHYDAGNDLYALFLGRRLVYSCAYFPTGMEDLDAAQEAKLELICRKLRLQSGQRLLDIGCGWGGLALYAAERYGVEVLGVTLSQAQQSWRPAGWPRPA